MSVLQRWEAAVRACWRAGRDVLLLAGLWLAVVGPRTMLAALGFGASQAHGQFVTSAGMQVGQIEFVGMSGTTVGRLQAGGNGALYWRAEGEDAWSLVAPGRTTPAPSAAEAVPVPAAGWLK